MISSKEVCSARSSLHISLTRIKLSATYRGCDDKAMVGEGGEAIVGEKGVDKVCLKSQG